MKFRFVDFGWPHEISHAIAADVDVIRVICPFIKLGALERMICRNPKCVAVITRFNLNDFAAGVSDVTALRRLLDIGADVRGIKNLHAKLYLFGSKRAILTSANLTAAGLDRNHEFGIVFEDDAAVSECLTYFKSVWRLAGSNLTERKLQKMEGMLAKHRASRKRRPPPEDLGDFGKDIGLLDTTSGLAQETSERPQAFVKFIGTNNNRSPRSRPIIEIIKSSECHRLLGYPKSKRPRAVRDGATMFIGGLTSEPNDIRVFGYATGSKHRPSLDEPTKAEIRKRAWKRDWPMFVRLGGAQFVKGTLSNGVSLNELMDDLVD